MKIQNAQKSVKQKTILPFENFKFNFERLKSLKEHFSIEFNLIFLWKITIMCLPWHSWTVTN